MKRTMHVCTLLAALLLAILLMPQMQAAAAGSGTCGKNLTWTVNNSGTLIISGTGAMTSYSDASSVPWAAEDVYAVAVEEGVTIVGKNAFGGMFLDSVTLPESLTAIGANAFSGTAVTEAHFAGNLKQWEKDITIGSGNETLTDVIVCEKDVTYEGAGFSLANGVVTSYVNGLPGDFRTEYNDYIFEVVFKNVKDIGEYAVLSLSEVRSVTIPKGVTSIGYNAFTDCRSLTGITIPNGVTLIGNRAFSNCISLTSVKFPNTLTSIGEEAFKNCAALTSITIPDSVITINDYAFEQCSGLTSVTMGKGLTSVGNWAFGNCENIAKVMITDLAAWSSINFNGEPPSSPLFYAHKLYLNGKLLTNLIIPNGVTNIGRKAFVGCNVKSVSIPDSVMSISVEAFSECSNLTSVTIPDSVTVIESSAFSYCAKLAEAILPDNLSSISSNTFSGCTNLKSITIGNAVKEIKSAAFSGCSNLTDLFYDGTAEMWDGIIIEGSNNCLSQAIHHYAVAGGETGGCRWSLSESGLLKISGQDKMADYEDEETPWYIFKDQITEIQVKPYVKSIGKNAFRELDHVTRVTGMDGVTAIGDNAFSNCSALNALSLPATVTTMGQNVFSGCSSLISTGPAGSGAKLVIGWNRTIPANAFYGADCLESLTVPEGVTRIMASAAANCPALWKVSLPSTLLNIQRSAFSDCTSLAAIIFPTALTTIGDSAFSGCTALWDITIPESVISIGSNVFADCTSLRQAFLNNGLETIGDGAFRNTELTYIDLPATVTTIGEKPFDGCSLLTRLAYPAGAACPDLGATALTLLTIIGEGNMLDYDIAPWASSRKTIGTVRIMTGVTSIGNEAFCDHTALSIITIPEGVTRIGEGALSGCSSLKTIAIPKSVTIFDNAAFHNNALLRVDITDLDAWSRIFCLNETTGPLSKGAELWLNGEKVTELTITEWPEDYSQVFFCCGSLETVYLYHGATPYGGYSFLDCAALTDIYYFGEKDQFTSGGIINFGGYSEAKMHILVHHERLDPTCEDEGMIEYWSCTACDDLLCAADHFAQKLEADDLKLSALGHTPAEPAEENCVNPTCTGAGSYDEVVYCSVCGDELSRETRTVDALGHDLVHHDAKAPTCTEIGWDDYDVCSRCGHTTYVEQPALGHDYSDVVTEPTCTEKGFTTHTCSRCGDTYIDAAVDALGHDWSAWTVTAKPSADKEGVETRSCRRCGAVETRPIPCCEPEIEEVLIEDDEIAVTLNVEREQPTTVLVAGFDENGRLCMLELVTLEPGEDTAHLTIEGAASYKVFAADGTSLTPLCESVDVTAN